MFGTGQSSIFKYESGISTIPAKTNVSVDKHAGEIATGRVYGGAIEKGTEIYLEQPLSKRSSQELLRTES